MEQNNQLFFSISELTAVALKTFGDIRIALNMNRSKSEDCKRSPGIIATFFTGTNNSRMYHSGDADGNHEEEMVRVNRNQK